jgi:hypothetical protein
VFVLEKAKGVVDEEEACRSFFATSFLFCSSLDFGFVSEWMGGGMYITWLGLSFHPGSLVSLYH